MKEAPRDLNEDEVRAASEGRSEAVLGKKAPMELSEDEVREAAEGKSEAVVEKKRKKKS